MSNEKKYNELVGKIKNAYLYAQTNSTKAVLEDILPELAESEDERIRKEFCNDIWTFIPHEKAHKYIAWFEKQGKFKKYIFKSIPRLLDMIEPTERAKAYTKKLINTLTEEGYITDAKIVEECLKQMNGEHVAMAVMDEKRGEQKPADKVEPKFHEGDWIVQENIGTYKVIEVCESWYEVIDVEDNHYSIAFDKEYMCHFWTIQDAKEGDILVASDGSLFIFAKIKDNSAYYHFSLSKNGSKEISDGKHAWETAKSCYPANKKQRELLFKKIKESDYEWDDNKKELKKIEQKFTDKVESKFKVGNWYQCTKDFFGKGVTFDKNTAYYCAREGCLQDEYGCHIVIVKDLYDNFKLWSIEDAKNGDVLVDVYGNIGIFKQYDDFDWTSYYSLGINGGFQHFEVEHENEKTYPATKEQHNLLFTKMKEEGYDWDADKKELKKIEQKSAWSEEDEKRLKRAIHIFEDNLENFENTGINDEIDESLISWLKSLKERIVG